MRDDTSDSTFRKNKIFLRGWVDRNLPTAPGGQISWRRGAGRSSRHKPKGWITSIKWLMVARFDCIIAFALVEDEIEVNRVWGKGVVLSEAHNQKLSALKGCDS